MCITPRRWTTASMSTWPGGLPGRSSATGPVASPSGWCPATPGCAPSSAGLARPRRISSCRGRWSMAWQASSACSASSRRVLPPASPWGKRWQHCWTSFNVSRSNRFTGVIMKKLAKIIGLVLLVVVVLVIAVLFFVTRMFDPNDYKEQIRQAAREQANVELTLGGDIGWSLFPWLGIELKDVGLAPLEHPEQTLARIGSMGLGVEVLPLLRKQLRMSDVILDSISLNLEVDENGVANWSTIGPQGEAQAAGKDPAGEAEAEAEAEEHGRLDVAVESVRITNAAVSYLDRRTAQKVTLEDVNLSTGALIENEPFDVEFLGLLVTGQPAMRVRIDLRTVASF